MTLIFTRIKNKTKNIEHDLYLKRKKQRLKNKNPSIISNNCVGGVMSHDLGQQFCSPTVNLYFKAEEYIRFLRNLKYYLSLDVVQLESDLPYPVGIIDDVRIFFMHYSSFEEAKRKWDERKKRVNFSNLYVIMTEKEECTEDLMKQFDALEYRKKILFTHLPHPELQCAHYISGFENEIEMGILTDQKNSYWQRRYIDDYDYVTFLNE